jgi:hypothetical protein
MTRFPPRLAPGFPPLVRPSCRVPGPRAPVTATLPRHPVPDRRIARLGSVGRTLPRVASRDVRAERLVSG